MSDILSVKMGDMRTGHNPGVLATMGVGSCIVIILYDPITRLGGMAHAMLPSKPQKPFEVFSPERNSGDAEDSGDAEESLESSTSLASSSSFKYVDIAIPAMIQELVSAGANRGSLIAKLIGGAHMFALLGDSQRGIGMQNLEAARRILAEQRIPVNGEETGGTVGRNVRFDVSTGVCQVETKM